MEILQTKIYNKTDNFDLEKGQSYPDLKSTLIIHQKDVKNGKIYVTDYDGYCIEIFDIELNQKMEDLIRNFDAYKLSVSQLFNETKVELKQDSKDKDDVLKQSLTEKITENKTSIENLRKKLPKDLKIEGNKLKLILNDDTVLGDITITVSSQNTKIKEFKYDAGVFKIIDTEDNIFPSGTDLTQLFAPKNHNHDTEYVKLNDSRITTQYLPLSWNKRNNKEIIRTQSDNWLRINDLISHPNGVYFGNSVVRTDNQIQVGEDGDKIRLSNDGTIDILNRTKIVSRNNGDIAFGNNAFNDLVYGEFKGIKIWGNNSDDKVVLAGGGVKNLSDFNFLPLYALNNTNDINTYLSNGKFFAAESYNTQNMPANDWWHVFGGRHTNGGNNFSYYFAIPFSNRGDDNFYFKNVRNDSATWTKFIGFKDAGRGYQEMYNEHGYHLHYPAGRAFRVYQGNIGSGILKLAVTETEVFSPKRIESDSGFHYRNRSNDDVLLNNGGSLHKDNFFINRGNPYNITGATLNTFRSLPSGGYYVNNGGGSGLLLSFVGGGSTSSLEFYKADWQPETRIQVRNTVDSNRFNDDNGGFRDLAWFSDLYRSGATISGDWLAEKSYQNSTIFVQNYCNIELSELDNFGSISFCKVFTGGNITFSCHRKTIIYTSSNTFNGGEGSIATVSIFYNKCYIDIKNV